MCPARICPCLLSVTRTARDIQDIREILNKNHSKMQIIAKIESIQGVNNIDEILEEADGVMVARGDLGVEVPLEKVPAIQKMIIHKAEQMGKQVVTATQMLDSMMHNPRPTRAETTDVANLQGKAPDQRCHDRKDRHHYGHFPCLLHDFR